MAIDWISAYERLPDNRREVLCWGHAEFPGYNVPQSGKFLGVSKCNITPEGGRFDLTKGRFFTVTVTHWAEIEGPLGNLGQVPPKPPPQHPGQTPPYRPEPPVRMSTGSNKYVR